MQVIRKTARQLVKGDIVRMAGGRFEVIENPRESQSHRPEGYWPADSIGPSACVSCTGVCLEGEVPGFFKPGTEWGFQGNHHSSFCVEI